MAPVVRATLFVVVGPRFRRGSSVTHKRLYSDAYSVFVGVIRTAFATRVSAGVFKEV